MNFFKRLLKDDDDIYEENYNEEYTDDEAIDDGDIIDDGIPPAETEKAAAAPARPGVAVRGKSSAVSLRVMRPKSFDDGPEIADYVASGCTVVMNIEDLNREHSRRLIDFLLGAVHVIGGDLQMASQTTFVVAPCSVGVGDDEEEEEEDTTFSNTNSKDFGFGK